MAERYETIARGECNEILSALVGLSVTRPWLSIGETLFLEIGRLKKEKIESVTAGAFTVLRGRACIGIESDWRVEGPRSIQFGRGFGERKIENRLATLKGVRIERIAVAGELPELCVCLSDGRRIRSLTDDTTQPRWYVSFDDLRLIQLGDEWDGADVTPFIGVRRGRPCIIYCYT